MDRALRVVLVTAVLLASPPLRAAEIRWSGSPDCRRELEVAEQVESMTGRPLATISIADFELQVAHTDANQWQVELKTRLRDGAESSRSIVGAGCAEVTDAAAVAIALAVGPQESAPAPVESGQPAPRVAFSAPAPTTQTPTQPTDRSSLEWALGLGGTLDSSSTPNPAVGGALRLAMSWRPTPNSQASLRFELEGALYAPTEITNLRGQGGQFRLGYVAPLVCGARPLRATALLACVGYELGQLSGEGAGSAVTDSRRRGTFWSAARAEVGILVPIGAAVHVTGRLGAALPFVRREFVLDGSNVVFQPAAFSARGQIGFELLL